jgi:hypothetical protein
MVLEHDKAVGEQGEVMQRIHGRRRREKVKASML